MPDLNSHRSSENTKSDKITLNDQPVTHIDASKLKSNIEIKFTNNLQFNLLQGRSFH